MSTRGWIVPVGDAIPDRRRFGAGSARRGLEILAGEVYNCGLRFFAYCPVLPHTPHTTHTPHTHHTHNTYYG